MDPPEFCVLPRAQKPYYVRPLKYEINGKIERKFINVLLYDRDIVETEQDMNQNEPGSHEKRMIINLI